MQCTGIPHLHQLINKVLLKCGYCDSETGKAHGVKHHPIYHLILYLNSLNIFGKKGLCVFEVNHIAMFCPVSQRFTVVFNSPIHSHHTPMSCCRHWRCCQPHWEYVAVPEGTTTDWDETGIEFCFLIKYADDIALYLCHCCHLLIWQDQTSTKTENLTNRITMKQMVGLYFVTLKNHPQKVQANQKAKQNLLSFLTDITVLDWGSKADHCTWCIMKVLHFIYIFLKRIMCLCCNLIFPWEKNIKNYYYNIREIFENPLHFSWIIV